MNGSTGLMSSTGNGAARNGSSAGEMDFKALAMESESLLSHIARPDGIPRLTKSLAEIERGSQRMGVDATERSRREAISLGVTPDVAEQKQELKGGSMLARNRFDPEALVRAVKAVELKAGFEPLQPLRETDIEGYLAHHHDMIVARAVEESRRAAEDTTHVRQREWEVDSWRKSKKELLGSLSHGGDTLMSTDNQALRSGTMVSTLTAPGERAIESGAGDARAAPGAGAEQALTLFTRPEGNDSVDPPLLPWSSNVSRPSGAGVRSKLEALDEDFARVVRELNEKHSEERDSFPLATALAREVSKTVPDGVKSGPKFARAAAWSILRMMFEDGDWKKAGESSAFSRINGTLRFLEKQRLEMLEEKVSRAKEARTLETVSSTDTATGLQPKIRMYMQLNQLAEPSGVGEPMHVGFPVWPQIYFCMRCGRNVDAANAARDASVARQNSSTDADELRLLAAVSDVLRNRVTRNGRMDVIKAAFDSMPDGQEMYKRSVLNILSRANHKKVARIHRDSIEDYMWFKLSFVGSNAQDLEVLQSAQAKVTGKDPRRNFDPDGRNPFAYVNVLLYTQQLEEVVSFLCWKGEHSAALHMALVMNHHRTYSVADSSASLYGTEPGPAPSLKELIESYIHIHGESHPDVCTLYMMALPTPVIAETLSNLAVRVGSGAASKLFGYRSCRGHRTQGILDRFLDADVTEDIAFTAAQKAEAHGRRVDALTFYATGRDFTRMALLLAREMSERLAIGANERDLLKEAGQKTEEMLVMTPESVSDHRLSMAKRGITVMLRLMECYEYLSKNKMEQARSSLEEAGVIPRSHDDAVSLANEIKRRSPDDAVRIVLPQVLELGMQCLRHRHMEITRDLQTGGSGKFDIQLWRVTHEKSLQSLEEQGQYMLSFAGRLHDILPASFVANVSRLEANIG